GSWYRPRPDRFQDFHPPFHRNSRQPSMPSRFTFTSAPLPSRWQTTSISSFAVNHVNENDPKYPSQPAANQLHNETSYASFAQHVFLAAIPDSGLVNPISKLLGEHRS